MSIIGTVGRSIDVMVSVCMVHISPAPSVEQLRQKPSSIYLWLGLMLSQSTKSLFDRNAAALAVFQFSAGSVDHSTSHVLC